MTPGDGGVITRQGFQFQCKEWSGDTCIEPWFSVPANAFKEEAPCGVPDKTSLRPVWHGDVDEQCKTICWIATGDPTCISQNPSGKSATHSGWMYTGSPPICDDQGRQYSTVTIPEVGDQTWSYDSMNWSREGTFSQYQCNW